MGGESGVVIRPGGAEENRDCLSGGFREGACLEILNGCCEGRRTGKSACATWGDAGILWLFAAQGDHGVDAGGAAGRDVTCEQRNQREQRGDCNERQRVR